MQAHMIMLESVSCLRGSQSGTIDRLFCVESGVKCKSVMTVDPNPKLTLRQRHVTLCIAAQAAYRSCSGAFVSYRAGVQSIGCRLSLHPQTLTCDQTAICCPGQPFTGLHSRNPCNYIYNYSFTDPEGMEGCLLSPLFGVTSSPMWRYGVVGGVGELRQSA